VFEISITPMEIITDQSVGGTATLPRQHHIFSGSNWINAARSTVYCKGTPPRQRSISKYRGGCVSPFCPKIARKIHEFTGGHTIRRNRHPINAILGILVGSVPYSTIKYQVGTYIPVISVVNCYLF